eukprot:86709-Alexandrium_andersonii.AAC.1
MANWGRPQLRRLPRRRSGCTGVGWAQRCTRNGAGWAHVGCARAGSAAPVPMNARRLHLCGLGLQCWLVAL